MVDANLEWAKFFAEYKSAYEKYSVDSQELVHQASLSAKEKHSAQNRDNGEPYIIHPVRVARIVFENKRSKNISILLSAALLHDTLEDTYTSYRELTEVFGETVASLVMELTTASCACRLEGKDHYLSHKMEHMTSYALYVKLADRLDNLQDLDESPAEKRTRTFSQTKNIISYLSRHVKFTTSQQRLVDKINKVLKEKTA